MANTENIEAKLAAYVDGELDPAGQAEIEQYLTTNPQHRALIDELRSARSYLKELPRAAAPAEVAEMISQQLERAALLGDVEIGGGSGSTNFSRWPQVRAIAAIIILTAGLAGVLYTMLPSPKPSASPVAIIPSEPRPEEADLDKLRSPVPGPEVADSRDMTSRAAPTGAAGAGVAGVAPSMAPEPRDSTPLPGAIASIEPARANTLYLMVNTPDPASANTQVVSYFATNRINYEQLPPSDSTLGEAKRALDQQGALNAPQQPAAATSSPSDFDNVAPRQAGLDDASKDLGVNAATTQPSATTSPSDKADSSLNYALEANRKQQAQHAAPVLFKARMRRDEATLLRDTLSQPKMGQVAQIVTPVVTPESRQAQQDQLKDRAVAQEQLAEREKAQSEQLPGFAQAPTTNETSPTTGPAARESVSPQFGMRGEKPISEDALAPGDTILVRLSEPLSNVAPILEETKTIDENGYVELPNVGRVKAAGQTPYQLTSSIVPKLEERTRETQSPRFNVRMTIEKVTPDAVASSVPADNKAPAATTQEAGGKALTELAAGAAADPTTAPTTMPTDLLASAGEQLDVVVIVQSADVATTAPASDATLGRPLVIEENATPTTTQPATQPATAPSR